MAKLAGDEVKPIVSMSYLAFSKQAPLPLLLAVLPPKSLSADAVEGAVYFEAREVLSCCFRNRVDFLEKWIVLGDSSPQFLYCVAFNL